MIALAENLRKKAYAAMLAALAVLGIALCVGLCGAQQAWADGGSSAGGGVAAGGAGNAVDLGAPEHSKVLTSNGDGTYDLTLSVTGKSQASSEKTKANVIVVLDTSGSMDDAVGVFTYEEVGDDDSGSLFKNRYGKVGDEYVLLYWTPEIDLGFATVGGYWRTSFFNLASKYSGTVYKRVGELDRLTAAKSAVNGLANQLLSSDSADDSAVQMALVAFDKKADIHAFSGTNWTSSYSDFSAAVNALTADGGTNWEDALCKADSISFANNGYPTYVVFVSDGNPTYYNKGNGVGGNGGDDRDGKCYDNAKDDARAIVNPGGKEFYAVNAFGDADKMQSLVGYAYTGSDEGTAPEGRYFEVDDQNGLNAAFSSIVSDITKSYTYTDAKITDEMSAYADVVLDGSGAVDFAYNKGGKAWSDAPVASYDPATKTITWDLGNIVLEKDVVYSVTFKVKANQAAYDAVAAVANGKSKVGVKAEGDGYSVCTNNCATLEYSQQKTVNGESEAVSQESVEYVNPFMAVPVSSLEISKVWSSVPASFDDANIVVNVEVKQDGSFYDSVALNAANEWKKTLVVPAGPVGHEYSIEEVSSQGPGWSVSYGKGKSLTLKGLEACSGSFEITNSYSAFGQLGGDNAAAKIEAKKTLTGRNLAAEEFSFAVMNGESPVADATNAADGSINFSAIQYSTQSVLTDVAAGRASIENGAYVYTYQVVEKIDALPVGVTPTASSFTIKVRITDDGEGKLTPEVVYPKGASSLEFVNQYGSGGKGEAKLVLSGTKHLSSADGLNRPDIEGKYTFTLTGKHAEGGLVAKNDAVGNVSFSKITYTMDDLKGAEVDEYGVREAVLTYTVTETGNVEGVANDPVSTKTFTVTLKDDGQGNLSAVPSKEVAFDFINTYSVSSTESSLTGEGQIFLTKVLEGRDLQEGEFEFQLVDSETGEVVATGANAADGSVSMSSVKFSKPGEYRYVLSEVQGKAENVVYDDSKYCVTARVSDNGNGTMSVAWTASSFGDEAESSNGLRGVVFKNSYEQPEVAPPVTPETPDPGADDNGGEEPEEPAASDDSNAKEPVLAKTGDGVSYMLAGVGALAVAAVAVCVFARRKLG